MNDARPGVLRPVILAAGIALAGGLIGHGFVRARESAEQFARDSGGRLDGIRQASQGVFEIQPRDPVPGASEENQLNKTVRVVTTVQYALAG